MLAQFGLQLIGGIGLMWWLLPRDQVTSGFFRIQMLLVLGLSVVAGLAVGHFSLGDDPLAWRPLALRILAGAIAATAYVGSVLWTLNRRPAGTVCVHVVLLAALAGIGVAFWRTGEPNWLSLASSYSTAAVLGGMVTGMLLGHWYLTAPTMSIAPLAQLCRCLTAAVAVRLALSAVGWWWGGADLHGGLHWTWFSLRWLAGVMGPAAICGMALRILRYKNTQAATGVLFAGVILTFIGEMSAALLYGELHRPL